MYKLLCLLVIYVAVTLAKPGDKYETRYDDVDLDKILNNKRLLQGYCNCLLDEGPCSPDAAELKKNLPDAIQDDCSKCSEKQKAGAKKVLHHLIDNEDDCWDPLETKYDAEGIYRTKYRAMLKKKN